MLAIVASFKEWRHYLEMPAFTVRVVSDHHNLITFMTMKNLNRRQARWAIKLSVFDFVIFHRRGKENPADGPSRRPDYAIVDPEEENPLRELIQSQIR
jgi:RNase H-like domain found in reverse transcriptase